MFEARRSKVQTLAVVSILVLVYFPLYGFAKESAESDPAIRVREAYANLPLSFEANQGQTNSRVKFLSRGRGYNLFLTPTEAVLALKDRQLEKANPKLKTQNSKCKTILRMKLLGANSRPTITGLEALPGKVNYFIGNNPNTWHTNISIYKRVKYEKVYSGVDLVYYGNQKQLEYDFILAPGADPKAITLAFELAQEGRSHGSPLRIDEGDLVLQTDGGAVRLHKPYIYQDVNGTRQSISGGYRLHEIQNGKSKIQNPKSKIQNGESKIQNPKSKIETVVTFEVGAYDTSKPLVIDPVLVYSTYLGGSGGDLGRAIAVDADGHAYVTGDTESIDFPTSEQSLQRTYAGGGDAFVTKLNAEGSALVYSTYLGGGGIDEGRGIAVDADGHAYVTGATYSDDFPTTAGAFQIAYGGDSDAFVTKLNAEGSALVYSTYLGGGSIDQGRGIAIDADGSSYVTGDTSSRDFPISNAFQTSFGGFRDGFVTKLNAEGSALVYSTYLGGFHVDYGFGIAVDGDGCAYVTGQTLSNDFPTTEKAFQSTIPGFGNAFVTKLDPDGSALVYSTFLGGLGGESGTGIAVDADGHAYVTGSTGSIDFPTTPDAFQNTLRSTVNAFVTKLNPSGSAPVYSTYLGGDGVDEGRSIAIDADGHAYITGQTRSTTFPTTKDVFQTALAGGSDAFVAKLNPTGSDLIYATYLGGDSDDVGAGIAVDAGGGAYVTGYTNSTNFRTTPGAFQSTYAGDQDAFVAKIGP